MIQQPYYFVFCYACGYDDRRAQPFRKCPDCWDTNIETGLLDKRDWPIIRT